MPELAQGVGHAAYTVDRMRAGASAAPWVAHNALRIAGGLAVCLYVGLCHAPDLHQKHGRLALMDKASDF